MHFPPAFGKVIAAGRLPNAMSLGDDGVSGTAHAACRINLITHGISRFALAYGPVAYGPVAYGPVARRKHTRARRLAPNATYFDASRGVFVSGRARALRSFTVFLKRDRRARALPQKMIHRQRRFDE
ncbi:hypothetical protein CKO51_10905 [Rhodopirellula sp. SM50]|nr:hypothetical protein CKO51_10905 [Rhodopirellula sp. SM50]